MPLRCVDVYSGAFQSRFLPNPTSMTPVEACLDENSLGINMERLVVRDHTITHTGGLLLFRRFPFATIVVAIIVGRSRILELIVSR